MAVWLWSIGLGVMFSGSATAKYVDLAGFRRVLRYSLPLGGAGSRVLAATVVAVEAILAAASVVAGGVPGSFVVYFGVAAGVLCCFTGWLMWALARGYRIDCRCFGSTSKAVSWRTMIRNVVLITGTVLALVIAGRAGSVPLPLDPLGRMVVAVTAVAQAAAFATYRIARPYLLTKEEAPAPHGADVGGRCRAERGAPG